MRQEQEKGFKALLLLTQAEVDHKAQIRDDCKSVSLEISRVESEVLEASEKEKAVQLELKRL